MPDPTSSPVQPKLQVWTVAVSGGAPRLVAEGDDPAIAPAHAPRRVRPRPPQSGSLRWMASQPPQSDLRARRASDTPTWSPDGSTLAFVSDRDDHSFIALFTATDEPLRYLAPSTSRDSEPAWSPDGSRILFVRRPGAGGVPCAAAQAAAVEPLGRGRRQRAQARKPGRAARACATAAPESRASSRRAGPPAIASSSWAARTAGRTCTSVPAAAARRCS